MLGLWREVAEINVRDDLRFFSPCHLEIVGCQSVPPASRTCMGLDEKRARLFTSLKLDKMIARPERAELLHASFRLALSTKRGLPVVINRKAMALGTTAVKRSSVFFNVVFSAAANQVFEFASIQPAELDALAASAHVYLLHNGAVESELLIKRSRVGRHIGFRADHPAIVNEYTCIKREIAVFWNGQAVNIGNVRQRFY